MIDQDKNNNSDSFKEEEEEEIIKLTSDEHQRLGGYPPLNTIISQSSGPLISQLTMGLYGVVDSMWITNIIGEIGLAAVSASMVIDFFVISFSFFVSIAASTRLSYLFSKNKYEEANQVVVDLLKVSLLIGIVIPSIVYPFSRTIINFLDPSPQIMNMSVSFLIPRFLFLTTTCSFLALCGVLQAEGRSLWFGAAQVLSFSLNMVVFDPLFLYSFKKIWGASLATVISELFPLIIILYYLFSGKLTCKPKFSHFLNPISEETYKGLKTGSSTLIMNISSIIPGFVLQKYVAIASNKINQYEIIMSVMNAATRLSQLSLAVVISINSGYLPVASYAFGSKNNKRILSLTFHASWISFIWSLIITLLICIFPGTIAKLWSKNIVFLDFSIKILPICFYTITLCSLKFIFVSFLQSTNRPISAMILSILTELLPLPIFSSILHFTGEKNDPIRIFYSYIFNDVFAIIVCLIWVTPSLIDFHQNKNDNN